MPASQSARLKKLSVEWSPIDCVGACTRASSNLSQEISQSQTSIRLLRRTGARPALRKADEIEGRRVCQPTAAPTTILARRFPIRAAARSQIFRAARQFPAPENRRWASHSRRARETKSRNRESGPMRKTRLVLRGRARAASERVERQDRAKAHESRYSNAGPKIRQEMWRQLVNA